MEKPSKLLYRVYEVQGFTDIMKNGWRIWPKKVVAQQVCSCGLILPCEMRRPDRFY
ncbi:hypothetical protein OIU76_018159, partial [Salix suchowensis]